MTNKTDSAPIHEIHASTGATSTIPLLNDKMVDMIFITEFTGLTDKWFYKLISEGQFPKPIKLGRSSRWLQSEVENWVQSRIERSRA
ncbi:MULTISPECIES: helix-turn-helix transcriptional regulator [unclassified Serratia (in: enterobacteria)]|uniref:helix-turn-helix transcriptional regulator n=1 Tax=unclassified Serratia (in: enterobacteria) TaxID=2647522 RepID=UPI003076094D